MRTGLHEGDWHWGQNLSSNLRSKLGSTGEGGLAQRETLLQKASEGAWLLWLGGRWSSGDWAHLLVLMNSSDDEADKMQGQQQESSSPDSTKEKEHNPAQPTTREQTPKKQTASATMTPSSHLSVKCTPLVRETRNLSLLPDSAGYKHCSAQTPSAFSTATGVEIKET